MNYKTSVQFGVKIISDCNPMFYEGLGDYVGGFSGELDSRSFAIGVALGGAF